MDDLFRMTTEVKNAQEANLKMEELVGRKNLQFNLDKSAFLLVGSGKGKGRLQRSLDKSPLTLCGSLMKQVTEMKYFGESISSSLEESVQRTVNKRINLAKHAVIEVRIIIEDSRAEKIGGINVAFHIFKAFFHVTI